MQHLVRLLLVYVGLVSCISAQDKPHIVVVLGDDHGVYHSTPYGADEIQTPHMQALADEGMTFSRAYVASPACVPSRYSLMTGLMPSLNGVVGNHEHDLLKPGLEMISQRLLDQGYEVVFKGKVDHTREVTPPGIRKLGGANKPLDLTNVEDFLKTHDSSQPLALFIGTKDTHLAWPSVDQVRIDPNDVVVPPKTFDTPETRVEMSRYVEAVERVDRTLGETRAFIDTYLDPANTVLFYTSDHGQNWPYGKWSLYETGVRTPMLVVWPGKIQAKSTTRAMVSWVDLFPTFIDLAGGTQPENIDGRSFKEVLLGNTTSHHDQIFTIHKGDGDANVYPIRAVRTENWKYILNLYPEFYYTSHSDVTGWRLANFTSWEEAALVDQEAARFLYDYHVRPDEELYLVDVDPYEINNLAYDPRYADTLAYLRALVRTRMDEVNDDDTSQTGTPRLLVDNEIPAAIKILYPNGGEQLQPGDEAEVVWTGGWKGTQTVMVEYDDGRGWQMVAASVPHNGSYNWVIPAITSQTVKLRITSSDGDVSDESDGNFSISPQLSIGDPAGGITLRRTFSRGPGYVFTGDFSGIRSLKIANLSGAVSRVLAVNQAENSITWDGRNNEGNPVKAGVYFVLMYGKDGAARPVSRISVTVF